VAFLVVPPIQILDLTGPWEVFSRCGGYKVELLSVDRRRLVTSTCELVVGNSRHYSELTGRIDTLLVAGGLGAETRVLEPVLLQWMRRQSARVRRIGSICTGAFVLAEAGILRGRKAVTHWGWCPELAQRCPQADVSSDPIFVKDGNVYTSAGITAGIDLALALVEEDQGQRRALEIAREMVLFLRRSGGQSQFSRALASQASAIRPLEDLHAWVVDRLESSLSVDAMAARCGMSPRNFARVFVREKGMTPAKYVERLRVEAARAMLEETKGCSAKEVARRAGFGSPDVMRRSFIRVLGVTARDYVSRFR
jgi:transcriptional regulator GlxA family with amidase domain